MFEYQKYKELYVEAGGNEDEFFAFCKECYELMLNFCSTLPIDFYSTLPIESTECPEP